MKIEIFDININNKIIKFKRPFIFFAYKKHSLYYIDDNFVWIHEIAKNIKELKNKIKEELEIQWEDIVLEEDKNLNIDAQILKKYMLNHTIKS